MSIVTLKKKSRMYKAPISAGGSFSLTGGHRNVGVVGQTNLMRSRTSCCTNDNQWIKGSTKNTLGHIYASFKYPTSVEHPDCVNYPCPKIWVKNFSPDDYSQGIHIRNVVTEKAKCVVPNSNLDAGSKACADTCDDLIHIGGRKVMRTHYTKSMNHDVSAENYMRTRLMKNNCLPPPKDREHFPMALNHNNGCNIDVLTPQEAKDAGLLPADYKF
jgi:hypothetical protein